jgi:FG-GAP-like repeat/FG-GAP repeat
MRFSRVLSMFAMLACITCFSAKSYAVDFTVNLTTDEHDANAGDSVCDVDLTMSGEQCSLRAAVEQSDSLTSDDRILFSLPAPSTITLRNAEIGIALAGSRGSLAIIGSGAANLTIDGGPGNNRIFFSRSLDLTISGVTLTGGNGVGNFDTNGGAISASGSLTLDGVYITGNSVPASSFGGGLYIAGGARISNSTISGNTSFNHCGGIDNRGSATIVNSTISSNTAPNGPSLGAAFCNSGFADFRNVTITGNSGGWVGGISNAGTLVVGNSVIAGNTGIYPEIGANGGTVTSLGGNLIGDSPGDSTNTQGLISLQLSDLRDVDPKLGPLQFNGGPTPTHALLLRSPAIDTGLNTNAVHPATASPLSTDQRGVGFPRILDGNKDGSEIVDIGAFEAIPMPIKTPFDFDGDLKADLAIYRPSEHNWYILGSAGGIRVITWGIDRDKLAPADYDGDGKTDVAVFRPSTGQWFIVGSAAGFWTSTWGVEGDLPVPADYDDDGIMDIAVFRPSNGTWYRKLSRDGISLVSFGIAGDKPAPGDYDGDGKADLAVQRPSNNTFYLLKTSAGFASIKFGLTGNVVVPADYDRDGRTDVAIFTPNAGWTMILSAGPFTSSGFGEAGDLPVPADYDGDGKTNRAVYKPTGNSTVWRIDNGSVGGQLYLFGQSGDVPVASAYAY